MIIRSDSPERTREIGAVLGSVVGAGDVLVLEGDLGAGKTTFTQGLGEALGVAEPVTSPTFVVVREHRAAGTVLRHIDAYRLTSLPEWDDLDVDLESGVTVIEWGNRIRAGLPQDHLVVRFNADDDDIRTVEFIAAGPRSATLLESVEAAA